jgi:quercetin dioxygenase-like cupin family protein
MRGLSVACGLVLATASVARAQDPAKVDAKHYHVLVDNARVRVLHVAVPPGEKTPVHEHPDSIIIPLVNSNVRFTLADGKTVPSDLKAETAAFDPASKHAGENLGKTAVEALVVELKGNAAPTATIPASRPGIKSSRLLENPRADVIRATADNTFHEPAGTTHDYDQVIIALGEATLNLNVDGKATTKWKRGDVTYIGRGVKHESKNAGKPVDFIIVAIK